MPLLQTSDGSFFRIPFVLAKHSTLLRNIIEDAGLTNAIESSDPVLAKGEEMIPLQNITSPVMKTVIDWMKNHKQEASPTKEKLSEWDIAFLHNHTVESIFDIIMAANYLDIGGLLDLGCKTVANMMKGKTPQEIRQIFNMADNDNENNQSEENNEEKKTTETI